MKFGEKVRDLRKKHSLTQDELAQCLGINKRTIIGWERDGRYPRSIEMLEKMADIFHLSMTRNIPCAGVSTLRAMAENARQLTGIVCAVMDARCGQVYNALFRAEDGKLTRLCDDRALPIAELLEECKTFTEKIYLVGDGAELCYKTFAAIRAELLLPQLRFQRASGVAMAAQEMVENGQTVTPDALMPIYLRLPQAERELKAKNAQKNNK